MASTFTAPGLVANASSTTGLPRVPATSSSTRAHPSASPKKKLPFTHSPADDSTLETRTRLRPQFCSALLNPAVRTSIRPVLKSRYDAIKLVARQQRRPPAIVGRRKTVACASPSGWRESPESAVPPRTGDPSAAQGQPQAAQQPSALPQPYGVPERTAEPDVWDVVGLGQAMVDFSAMVPDDFLSSLGLPRGQRVVVDHKERGEVLQALDGCAYKLSAGGSLSNTLVALARLGAGGAEAVISKQAANGDGAVAVRARRKVNVAMVGSVGSDALGGFYRTKLLRANVHFLSPPIPSGTTGTVIVLTTPDAQRTMLSYQGMSSEVAWDAAMASVVAKSRVLVVEGYLWELPQTVDAIEAACAAARSKGLMVALTASDATCVLRHRPKFWSVLCRSAHVLFTNVNEARALAGCSESTSPAALAQHLSLFCPLVVVTDGEKGSYLGLRGQGLHIPAQPCQAKDTCGAGDAYAAGVLYALLMGAPDLESIGSIAARVSAVVVSQQGTRLGEDDAQGLVQSLGFPERSLAEGQVFHSMMGLTPAEEASIVTSVLS